MSASNSQNVLDNYITCRNQVSGKIALATITASAMGGWILFNPPEAGSSLGGITAVIGYCCGTAMAVFIYAFVGPRLRQIMPWGYSLNEYVRHRFDWHGSGWIARVLYWLVVAVMLLYMFVYLGLELAAISQVLRQTFSFPVFESSIIVIGLVSLYTAIGGLKATIQTDIVQFMVILPLLVICFIVVVVGLGGWSEATEQVINREPELLNWNNIAGLRFGVSVVMAIATAELLNQANWQRVFACKDEQTVRRAFAGSALIIFPLLLVAGWLGIMAAGRGLSGTDALFDLLNVISLPAWMPAAVALLALALVMSSMDSLINGITSVLTGEALRLSASISNRERAESQAMIVARMLTLGVSLAVVVIAQGSGMLYLFFVADILCAALAFPVIFSFFNRHQTAINALFSSLAGIAAGVVFLSKPDFSPLFNVPGSGDFLNSLVAALLVSTILTLLWTGVDKARKSTNPFNYSELREMRSGSKSLDFR
ncbi:MAG: Na+/proline symporter [Cyanobacteria bacterium J06650_10]